MPTYDYRCEACGHTLEIFHSISEAPKRKCPSCGKAKLERQIGAGAGILFKGSGFYQTDYRSESYKKAAGTERTDASAKSDAGAGGDASAKSEAGPSAKSSDRSESQDRKDSTSKGEADESRSKAAPAAASDGNAKASKPAKEGQASKSAAKRKRN